MPTKDRQPPARRASGRPVATPSTTAQPILRRSDVRQILRDLADRIAPADVESLLSREEDVRGRAGALEGPRLALLRDQTLLAIDCLRDHLNGTCPQIPYYSIAILGAAVSYFASELDVIPDFLPKIGRLDDALVMALACQLAAADLQRYCDATGHSTAGLPAPAGPRRRPTRA